MHSASCAGGRCLSSATSSSVPPAHLPAGREARRSPRHTCKWAPVGTVHQGLGNRTGVESAVPLISGPQPLRHQGPVLLWESGDLGWRRGGGAGAGERRHMQRELPRSPPPASCCAARFLTGHRAGPVHGAGVGAVALADSVQSPVALLLCFQFRLKARPPSPCRLPSGFSAQLPGQRPCLA